MQATLSGWTEIETSVPATEKRPSLAKLQTRWLVAHDRLVDLSWELRTKYGQTWKAPAGKQKRYEALQAAEDRASDAIFAWLDEHSPRDWRTSAPAHWICGELSEADALTSGPLSIVPPPPYGRTHQDMDRFAAALS